MALNQLGSDFQSCAFTGRPPPDALPGRVLQSISSIVFAPNGATAHLGCLLGDRLAALRVPGLAAP